MIDKIRTILQADSTLTTALGSSNNIFLEQVPQAQSPPYLVITMVDGTPNDSKTSTSKMDQNIINITAYAKQPVDYNGVSGSISLMDLVRDALDGYDGTVSGMTIYCRNIDTGSALNLSIPNKPMHGFDMDFEAYVTR